MVGMARTKGTGINGYSGVGVLWWTQASIASRLRPH